MNFNERRCWEIADQAMSEGWQEMYSSPEDAMLPLAHGTLDLCGGEDDMGGLTWWRVWCRDETARLVPEELREECNRLDKAMSQF